MTDALLSRLVVDLKMRRGIRQQGPANAMKSARISREPNEGLRTMDVRHVDVGHLACQADRSHVVS